jgi:putative hemolysin
MIYLYLAGCIIFLILQGFFSASEIGFLSSDILKLRNREEKKEKDASLVLNLLIQPEKFLVTILVGINFSVVISSSFLTFFLIKIGIKESHLWTTFLFTPLVVIFAELVPKNIGRYYAEDFSCKAVNLIIFFKKLFYPLLVSIEKVSRWLTKVFVGKKVRWRLPFVTKEEIKMLLKEIEKQGELNRGEKEAIEEIFEFRQSKIKDVCVDLKKVVALDYADSYEKVLEVIKEKGFTRYPVFKNREIIGYINIYDIFYHPHKEWTSFIRPITKVGINQKLYEVFMLLKKKKESIALVYKGKRIYGIVTLEDLIREIITPLIKFE